MKLRRIQSVKRLEGKRVLVRVDLNVPIEKGKVIDGPHGRIAQAAAGIQLLRKKGARVIVMTHLGRPKSSRDRSVRLAPVAARLSELLDAPVLYNGSLVGEKAEALIARLKNGGVALLENLRYDKREEENDAEFAHELAALADLYVNDAFGVCHRAHSSVAAITKELPSYMGPLLEREIAVLANVMAKPKRPFVLLLGGAKMETKIGLIQQLGRKANVICIGGALAHTFLVTKGEKIGTSLYEKDQVKVAKELLTRFGKKIVLPVDFVWKDKAIQDCGPRTMRNFLRELQKAKTIVWNGPLGRCEVKPFCEGTHLAARAIAAMKAETIVGGGDTVPILESLGVADRFTHVSTGGGAMLAFLSGEKLPAIEALMVK